MSLRNVLTASAVIGVVLGVSMGASAQSIDPAVADANFDSIMDPQSQLQEPVKIDPLRPWEDDSDARGAAVEVPLEAFDNLWRDNVASAEARTTQRLGPAVVLGATRYRGVAQDGALHLEVELSLTLGRPEAWKTVPLVGDGAVLIQAEVEGVPIGIAKKEGFHIWLTQRTGEVVVKLKIIVPARGPRGSIEFDFVGPRTPVTEFRCEFPGADLEPRIDSAVQSDVSSVDSSTTLTATLRPTTRIHVVGFRDLGDKVGTESRVYAETRSLVSIDDGVVEVFSEAQYTILYAGTKRFDVLVPKGVKVVSAEGKGAFRYELEARDDGTLIRGETAFPIRDAYAISLRLRTETGASGERFAVPLPKLLGVERDVGWMAVEVPGKLMLEEAERPEAFTAMDVRGLPVDLVRSAVSPILMAYRVKDNAAPLVLAATRLPEKDMASEQLDRIRAFTVVSAEGTTLTELRLTLRNRLRQNLAVVLPEGARVRSVLLDGGPVKPSLDESGRLLLPLKRSERTGSGLQPVTVQLVYELSVGALGWFGQRDLVLPTVELAASSLEWSVYLPSSNVYDRLVAEVARQEYWTEGSWIAPRSGAAGEGGDGGVVSADGSLGEAQASHVGSGDTGAMPVRITLPKTGHRLDYQRYWLEANQPVTVGVRYAQRWLTTPLLLLLMAGLLGIVVLASRRGTRRLGTRLVLALGGGVCVAALVYFFGLSSAVATVVLGGIIGLALRGTVKDCWHRTKAGLVAMPDRFEARGVSVERVSLWQRSGRVARVCGGLAVVALLVDRGLVLLGFVF